MLTIKNIIANKARVALITLAVVIGVSFVSSTFIFSDSLTKTFDELATDVANGTDLEVRNSAEFGTSETLTNDSVAMLAQLPGVRAVAADRAAEDIQVLDANGDLIDLFGVGMSWVDDAALSGFELTEGSAPGDQQFVLSATAARDNGFVVGETYGISTPRGIVDRQLSGIATFKGGEVIEANVAFTLLPLSDAQALFGGQPDQIDGVGISLEPTATAAAVSAAAQSTLGDNFEVVSQRTIQQEQAADFNAQISILRNLLLGFAIVSLFVSTFIIYNTFGIILNQRTREIGLLRAIGADAGHIGRSVIGESFIIGLIASALGLIAGIGLNAALISLFGRLGAVFPDMETVISGRTMLLAFAIGVGVTVLSALGPARQASRVAPVTAMTGIAEHRERLGRRIAAGSILTFVGVLSACFGLFTATSTEVILATIGLGIAAIFIGITLLSPVLARPIVNALGAPVARFAGVSGSLAQGNAARNRRRTANTAAALMIGLSLITTTLVVGQSVKQHVASTLDDTVSADFVVSNDFDPLTDEVGTRMQTIPELGAVLLVSDIEIKTGGEIREAEAVTFGTLDDLFDVSVTQGVVPQDGGATAMLAEPVAIEMGIGIGDPFEVLFENGATAEYVVSGLFVDTTLLATGMMLERSAVEQSLPLDVVSWVAAGTNSGVKAADAAVALEAISTDFPQVSVQTSTEYRESVEAQVDQLLSIVNVMLALSIVIALIGIGLTLALSVYERTREIGLLRAVGMTTRQVRRMVRWEAALISSFGAILGVVTGLAYGWGTVTALPDNIASGVAVPTLRLVLLLIAAAVAGLIAALMPARRAARMNILAAIAV